MFFSQGLASNAVIAKVNGELWDLDRPLEGDCTLELLTFDDEEAQAVNKSVFYLMKRVCVTELIAALCFLNVVLKKKNPETCSINFSHYLTKMLKYCVTNL